MRAKEYIAQNLSSIKHFDVIVKVINDLLPLRKNKEATDLYFNSFLAADIRWQNYLLQKELYDRKNVMQVEEPLLEENKEEVPVEIIFEVRNTLLEVIAKDESFGYLYYLLGTEKNSRYKSEPIDCIPNKKSIDDAILRYRDDYPKQLLDDYLDDDFNYKQYEFLNNNIFDNEDKILLFFNRAYQIYDEIRCCKHKVSSVNSYCNNLCFKTDKEKYFTIIFVVSLIEEFESSDTQLQRCKKILLNLVQPLSEQFDNEEKLPQKSNVFLNSKKGTKVNFIRVINVLCEMGFFTDVDKMQSSKKDVFEVLGNAFNCNLKSFQNDLSTTQSASNADMRSVTKIFEEMLAKQKEILEKK